MPAGSYVALTVTDTGPGMARAMLDKIFEPYFTSKEPGKGTGLGLSVVHGITKAAGGFVRVHSEPGQGTTFQVFFPACELTENEEDETPEAIHLAGAERILFVDDEPALAALAARFFGALGYRIRTFTDSRKAWACLEANPDAFDVVVTDQTMPQLTGIELARLVRGARRDIPLILCTGNDERADADTIRKSGVAVVLHKPILMRRLVEEVRRVLGSGNFPTG